MRPGAALAWVMAVESETQSDATDYLVGVMPPIGRHLPGPTPAIRALGEHVQEERPSLAGRCCTGDRPA